METGKAKKASQPVAVEMAPLVSPWGMRAVYGGGCKRFCPGSEEEDERSDSIGVNWEEWLIPSTPQWRSDSIGSALGDRPW